MPRFASEKTNLCLTISSTQTIAEEERRQTKKEALPVTPTPGPDTVKLDAAQTTREARQIKKVRIYGHSMGLLRVSDARVGEIRFFRGSSADAVGPRRPRREHTRCLNRGGPEKGVPRAPARGVEDGADIDIVPDLQYLKLSIVVNRTVESPADCVASVPLADVHPAHRGGPAHSHRGCPPQAASGAPAHTSRCRHS